MKKLRTLLTVQAVMMLFIGLYIVGAELAVKGVVGTGNQIASPPILQMPQTADGDNPIVKTFTLFAIFGILLALGAIIELVILFVSAFR